MVFQKNFAKGKGRIIVLIITLAAIVLIGALIGNSKSPKNLLIVSIDTLRPDHMGIYGYGKDTTPNIDRWAKKGMVFTNMRTVVPSTQPSFSAMMTGKEPVKSRIITNEGLPVSGNLKTLASILSENGFKTGTFVSRGYLLEQGFEDVFSNRFKFFRYGGEEDPGNEIFYHLTDRSEYENFILSSVEWLKERGDERFFLWVHLMDPHAPYFPPDEFRCKFNEAYCDEILGKSLEELEDLRGEYQSCQQNPVPRERVELMETLYDGNIAAGDRLVGKILEGLEAQGLDKSTLVVILSDHGEGFDHNYYFHHPAALYESEIKIPFVVIDPTRKGAAQSDLLLQNTDILPTLVQLLGVDYKNNKFDGKSFAGAFGPFAKIFPDKVRNNSVSINSGWTKFSITDGQFKYIYSLLGSWSCLNNGWTEEVYNLKDDPFETQNLAETDLDVKNRLKEELFDYLSDYNLPIENPYPKLDKASEGNVEEIKSFGY